MNRSSRVALAHPFGELWGQFEGLEVVGFDVGLVRGRLGVGPADDEQGQAVVGGHRGPTPIGADHDLEPVDGQIAPVGVVAPLEHGLVVVLRRLDRLGDTGVAPVGADHDPRPLDDCGPAIAATADADDRAVLDDHVVDGEPLAHLGASTVGGVDEDLVEHGPPR